MDPDRKGLVLVVDDQVENRDLLCRRLAKEGFDAIEAENGMVALSVLDEHPIDLILLDIMMPEMDGYQVLDAIRAHAEWSRIPVIVVSAVTDMDSVVHCIEMGAADYLPKPFNRVLLRARVAASVEHKRLRDREKEQLLAIQESEARLHAEMAEAAAYARSLLPPPLEGDITAAWEFIPSTQLGGDSLGYHWLDDELLAI